MAKRRSGPYLTDYKPLMSVDKTAYHRWRRSCAGKVRFESEETTKRVKGMVPYQCQFCPYWHLTHPKNTKSGGSFDPNYPKSQTVFQYRTSGGTTQTLKTIDLARRSFSFFLLTPDRWNVQEFVNIIWKHCGFMIEEVHFVESYKHPERGLPKHTYDLYFRVGRGFMRNSEQINKLMWEMEQDVRKLDIEMRDTHAPAKLQFQDMSQVQ